MNKLLITLLTGITVGILIAPAKGSTTRKKLMGGLNKLADNLSALKDKIFPDEDHRVYEKAFGAAKMSSYV